MESVVLSRRYFRRISSVIVFLVVLGKYLHRHFSVLVGQVWVRLSCEKLGLFFCKFNAIHRLLLSQQCSVSLSGSLKSI